MNDLIKSTQGLFSLLETLHPFCELQYLVKGKRNGKKQFSPSDLALLSKYLYALETEQGFL
jgi:hypothetical protein